MRLAVLSLSAVLLSGCSWLGGMTSSNQAYNYENSAYGGGATSQYGAQNYNPQKPQDPCMVYSPVQPVPQGCDPAQVTLATSQNHGAGQTSYATGGYGSHASSAHQNRFAAKPSKRLKKPKLRGALSMGFEESIQGSLLDFVAAGSTVPGVIYDPTPFNEGFVDASVPDELTTTTYTSAVENIVAPTLAYDDVHNTPLSLKAGFEFIASPHITFFANGGYAHAEGKDNVQTAVEATLLKTTSVQGLDAMGNPQGAPVTNTQFIPNENVANIVYDFNDQRRFDLEVGARHYFNPLVEGTGYKTLTPFVGAAVGISHHNDVTFKTSQNQRFLERAFEQGATDYYDLPPTGTVNTLYESDWLMNGQLTAGMEWQVTSGAAVALESGVKISEERDYVGGAPGEKNVSIPITLRGSFNF